MTKNAIKTAFSPFGYSSGESIVSTTDAQNVDFGTDTDNKNHIDAHVSGNGDSGDVVFNATRENITSDFGVVNYPFGMRGKIKKEKAVPVAIREPKKGARFSAGFTRGAPSGGGMMAGGVSARDSIQKITGSVDDQKESILSRFYHGQLGA